MTVLSVAVIGSSGGGTATLGHTDPQALMKTIDRQLSKIEGKKCCHGISHALFVALEGGQGFDHAIASKDTAFLYQIYRSNDNYQSPLNCAVVKAGSLKDVNAYCKELNKELAKAILRKEVHALICISMSVELFSENLEAAAAAGIPVTGTGGTSLSLATSKFQIRLVGNAGGSVANTSHTRAVSYTHALASNAQANYRPWKTKENQSNELGGPSWRSILNSCLPLFWGVCIPRRILDTIAIVPQSVSSQSENSLIETLSFLSFTLEHHAIPTACAVIAATSMSPSAGKDTSSLIMASVVASTVGCDSIHCGLLAGYLVSIWQETILYICIVQNIPATMTNLIATGGVGATTALVLKPVAPLLRCLTLSLRNFLLYSVTSSAFPPGMMSCLWGCFCCYGSKVGWYHSVILPIILIEMECGSPSFSGAIDELSLVLVCAGVCWGTLESSYLYPKKDIVSEADIALCKRAVRFNLLFGDFVEACYPFMERHAFINVGSYIASALSSYILVTYPGSVILPNQVPTTLAYLPLPASICLAGNGWQPMLLASVIAFGIPFFCVILNHSFLGATRLQ